MPTPPSIRAIIVDDELHARENMRFMLGASCPEVEVVGTAGGVKEALALFREVQPELVFLDIRMPSGAEGFDLLAELHDQKFYVVFVTAFKEYAIKAFEHHALHYILKPIDDRDLRKAVQRILGLQQNAEAAGHPDEVYAAKLESLRRDLKGTRILINHQKGVKVVIPEELTHVEGSGNCALLHFANGTQYLDTRTLKMYDELLPAYFMRTHRSYIVNMREVVEVSHGNDQSVTLRSGIQLPVSRDRKQEVIGMLQNL